MVEKLQIYQKSLDLVTDIYKLIRINSSLSKDWSLCDQIKRASVSVSANISEGYLRTKKHYKNYLAIASGSANEVATLLIIINRVYDIDTVLLQDNYKVLARQIGSFSSKIVV